MGGEKKMATSTEEARAVVVVVVAPKEMATSTEEARAVVVVAPAVVVLAAAVPVETEQMGKKK
jgi:hypothetical protein